MDQYPKDNWFLSSIEEMDQIFSIIMTKQQTYWILDQASDFVRPDLDPKCLHYHVLMKEYPERHLFLNEISLNDLLSASGSSLVCKWPTTVLNASKLIK